MSGKGSAPRPYSVDRKTFEDNWDKIFGNKESNENVWANRNVWNDPELAKQDRLADEIASIKNMKDTRSEAGKQEAAWLKDEYYDVDVDRDDTIV